MDVGASNGASHSSVSWRRPRVHSWLCTLPATHTGTAPLPREHLCESEALMAAAPVAVRCHIHAITAPFQHPHGLGTHGHCDGSTACDTRYPYPGT